MSPKRCTDSHASGMHTAAFTTYVVRMWRVSPRARRVASRGQIPSGITSKQIRKMGGGAGEGGAGRGGGEGGGAARGGGGGGRWRSGTRGPSRGGVKKRPTKGSSKQATA